MRQQEYQLITRIFPSQTTTLKLFAINSPQSLNELGLLGLYSDNGFREDEFCHDLLTVLRNLPTSCQSIELDSFLIECKNFYSSTLCDQSWDEIVQEFQYFIQRIRMELELFNLYRNDILDFNALWLDGNDSLIFFRMEKNDVPKST